MNELNIPTVFGTTWPYNPITILPAKYSDESHKRGTNIKNKISHFCGRIW